MSVTPVKISTWVVLLILCFSYAGCVHHSTLAERHASFSAYNESKVGEESLENFLIMRSAVLLMPETRELTSLGTNLSSFRNTSRHAWRGTAVPIDKRGYFLTTAHCVKQSQLWLLFQRDGKLQAEPARVVWRGDERKREPDLAILCVPHPIRQIFQWAAALTNGTAAVDVGLSLDERTRLLHPQCMAGTILKVSEETSPRLPHYAVISHSSPLHPGDSGGPLVLTDGRLLGINVNVKVALEWSHLSREREHSTAHRPDLAWLQKIIDADVTSHTTSAHTLTRENQNSTVRP